MKHGERKEGGYKVTLKEGFENQLGDVGGRRMFITPERGQTALWMGSTGVPSTSHATLSVGLLGYMYLAMKELNDEAVYPLRQVRCRSCL